MLFAPTPGKPGLALRAIALVLAAWTCGAARGETQASGSAPLPSAEAVVERVLARAKALQSEAAPKRYVYSKISVMEELGSKDEVRSKRVKEYEVTLAGGVTRLKLLKVDGKRVNDRDVKALEVKERKERGEDPEAAPKPRRSSAFITEELVRRFAYKVERREMLGTRPCLVLTFQPRSEEMPVNQMFDRALNRMAGTLWLDEQEAEVCRLEVRLLEKVTVWGGLLGAMETLSMNLNRERSSEGVWFNKNFKMMLQGRRLMDSMRMRLSEESSGFRAKD